MSDIGGLPHRHGHTPTDDRAEQIVRRLARGPHPTLNRETVARIEAHLLAAIPAHPVPAPIARPVRRWLIPALRVAAACLVLIVTLAGTASVSARSLPGDALYPVKRLVEQGQLALATDQRAMTLRLQFAGRRLDEFTSLLERGDLHLESLDSAAADLSAALTLLQTDQRGPSHAADRLFALSVRQVALAERAGAASVDDDRALDHLAQTLSTATRIGVQSRGLPGSVAPAAPALPPGAPPAHNTLSLAPDSTVVIAPHH